MNKNNFDDFLKDSFSDYSPEVPPHIWDNIAAQQKKKKPAGFWLNEKKALLILAALLFVGGGAYLLFNQKENTQNIAHENNGSRQEAGKTATAAVPENKIDNKIEQEVVNAETNLSNESTSAQQTNNLVNEADKSNSNDKTTEPVSANKNQNSNTGIRTEKKKTTRPLFRKTKNIAAINMQAVSADNVMNDGSANNNTDDNTSDAKDIAATELIPGNRDIISLMRENFASKQKIKTIQNSAIKISEDCPGNPSGNQSYFEAYISPDYAIKKYSDTANSSLVAKRKESLRFQSAYSAGLRYTKVFTNGMSIRAGVNFSQINEKFSYIQGNVVQIIYVINNQGDTTDSYYVRGTRYKNLYNHYRTIDVPVVIGYEMGNTNFHVNINAGPVINIYSWQSGETIATDGSAVNITTGKADNNYQYKTNIGIGFTAAASLYYKFSNRFHFLAEPYIRYNFAPMNRESLSIQEKFTTIGLRLGIRMDLK